jgi:hypothetical protein
MNNSIPGNKIRHLAVLLVFATILILFLVQRGGLVLLGGQHVYHPSFDEPASGTLAYDLTQDHVRAPFFTYQYFDHTGDVLLEALMLVPIYKLFGCSLLNLKLFAISSAFVTLLVWLIFMKRYQGLWAAMFFGILYAFPPPTFARLNVMGTLSSHHLLNAIMALQMLLLFRILENKEKISPWLLWGFGFFAGLGTYAFYTYIIFNFFCIGFLFIFRLSAFKLRSIGLFLCGALAGFSPWIVRSFFSLAGGRFLKSLLSGGSGGRELWNIILTFCYNLPHSLSYSYPARTIGLAAIVFTLFVLCLMGIVIQNAVSAVLFSTAGSLRIKLQNAPMPAVMGLLMCFFPLCFLLAVSLSSKQIAPFEYWQNIGLFATFAPQDCIRYRWFHILYPFYFAVAGIGLTLIINKLCLSKFFKSIFISFYLLFLLLGISKSLQLFSQSDQSLLSCYKGYNFDLMAIPFILGSVSPRELTQAEKIIADYPEENKPAMYECLGTKVTLELLHKQDKESQLLSCIQKVPEVYLNSFIFGVVRTAQIVSAREFSPFIAILARHWPNLFYENWGFRYLAYKYYGCLINQKVLLENIPAAEQWFYKNTLNKFRDDIKASDRQADEKQLLQELISIPKPYQQSAVKGLGKFIGSEMLFDPLCRVDYPLDSKFGFIVPVSLQDAFYEGIGRGFAETLCRFWRRLMPPEKISPAAYRRGLETELQRCITLMSKMPQRVLPVIRKGFTMELNERHMPPAIKNFLNSVSGQDKVGYLSYPY